MTLILDLPPDVETRLREWAAIANSSEEDIVRRALESYLAVPPDLRDELQAWQELGSEALEKVAPSTHEAW